MENLSKSKSNKYEFNISLNVRENGNSGNVENGYIFLSVVDSGNGRGTKFAL